MSVHYISSDLRSGCFADEGNTPLAYWWYKPRSRRLTVQVRKSRTSLSLYQYGIETLPPAVVAWHLIDIAYLLASWLGAKLGKCTFSHKVIAPDGFSNKEITG